MGMGSRGRVWIVLRSCMIRCKSKEVELKKKGVLMRLLSLFYNLWVFLGKKLEGDLDLGR